MSKNIPVFSTRRNDASSSNKVQGPIGIIGFMGLILKEPISASIDSPCAPIRHLLESGYRLIPLQRQADLNFDYETSSEIGKDYEFILRSQTGSSSADNPDIAIYLQTGTADTLKKISVVYGVKGSSAAQEIKSASHRLLRHIEGELGKASLFTNALDEWSDELASPPTDPGRGNASNVGYAAFWSLDCKAGKKCVDVDDLLESANSMLSHWCILVSLTTDSTGHLLLSVEFIDFGEGLRDRMTLDALGSIRAALKRDRYPA